MPYIQMDRGGKENVTKKELRFGGNVAKGKKV